MKWRAAVAGEEDLTVEYCREILDAVHVEGVSTNTLYSNIFDLTNGAIYIYYFHQFDDVAELSVAEEIAKNSGPTPIKNLFSEATLQKATGEVEVYKNQEMLKNVLLVAVSAVAICLIFLALWKVKRHALWTTVDGQGFPYRNIQVREAVILRVMRLL